MAATTKASSWTDWLPALISSGAGVAASIIGSRAVGSSTDKQIAASEKAAELERLSTKEALELQKGMYNRGIKMSYPGYQLASNALSPMGRGMGFKEPEGGYQTPTLKELLLAEESEAAGDPSAAGNGAGFSNLPPSSMVRPGGTVKPISGGALSGAGTGAMVGSIIPGVGTAIGAGVGALAGGLSGMIGRGRKEADQIVPYQEQLTREFGEAIARIKAKEAAGALSAADWQAEIGRLQPMYDEYTGLTQKFGRAGPGGRDSIAYIGDALKQWGGYAGEPTPRAKGGPVMGGNYIVGEKGPEILKMAPGSEGYVYPNSTFTSMMKRRMPGRAAGGGVYADEISPANNGQWKGAPLQPLEQNSPTVLPGAQGLAQNSFQAMMGRTTPYQQLDSPPPMAGAPVSSMPRQPGMPMSGTMPLPTFANESMPSMADTYAPNRTQGYKGWGTEGMPQTALGPYPGYSSMDGEEAGYAKLPMMIPRAEGGPVIGTTPDEMARAAAQAAMQRSRDQVNPYANMAAPFDVTPGEFMQPFQQPLPDPSRPDRPLPSPVDINVNKNPFSFNADDIYKDPSYNFRLSEGIKANERMASAGGRTLGGRTLKELTRYGQDYASTEYARAYDRALGENKLAYGRDVDEYGRKVDGYGRELDASNTMYGRDNDQYNRLLAQYGITYDIFRQNQADRYNRLREIGGL